jgi:pyruvate dehydrogenase E1 component alpha subunit
MIEALTYRLCDHTTADDASRYRDDAEVSTHWAEEPLLRLRAHLHAAGAWSKEAEEALLEDCREEAEQEAAAWLATPPQPEATIFAHTYATMPEELRRQAAEAVAR